MCWRRLWKGPRKQAHFLCNPNNRQSFPSSPKKLATGKSVYEEGSPSTQLGESAPRTREITGSGGWMEAWRSVGRPRCLPLAALSREAHTEALTCGKGQARRSALLRCGRCSSMALRFSGQDEAARTFDLGRQRPCRLGCATVASSGHRDRGDNTSCGHASRHSAFWFRSP